MRKTPRIASGRFFISPFDAFPVLFYCEISSLPTEFFGLAGERIFRRRVAEAFENHDKARFARLAIAGFLTSVGRRCVMATRESVYAAVTQTMIEQLERGVAPWVQPWTSGSGDLPLLPYNAASRRRYHGVNVLLLWQAALQKGYRHPAWIGYHQAADLGGHIKKGEKATWIVFASTFTPKEERSKPVEEQHAVPFLKWWDVFNVEQTAGLPIATAERPTPPPLPDALHRVEVFLATIGANLLHGGDRAFYAPHLDLIVLPEPPAFHSTPDYYATSLHEHAHWTGHSSRLNRDFSGRFGTAAYAAEELVAELTAAFLCALLAIPGHLRHAEYLATWLKLLQDDTKAIFTAAARATEAAQYLETAGGLSGGGPPDNSAIPAETAEETAPA